MNGQLVLGQVAVLNADALKDGTKKNLLNILVHLDEKKFLKPEFNYNKENAAEVAEQVKNRNLELAKKLKEVQEYVAEQVRAEGSDFVDRSFEEGATEYETTFGLLPIRTEQVEGRSQR